MTTQVLLWREKAPQPACRGSTLDGASGDETPIPAALLRISERCWTIAVAAPAAAA